MENEIVIFLNITNYKNTTSSENKFFQIYCGILSTICIIPNLISIIILTVKKGKMYLQQRIQLLLCITFIGIEIRFIPLKLSNTYFYFQAGLSFSFIILATYYQFIYSYIAYKLFTSPDDLQKKCKKFFINIFPFILFVFLIIFVILHSNLTLYFEFIAYPENPESGPSHQLSKRVSHVLRITFFLMNIYYVIKLLKKINEVIKIELNKNSFTNKKYSFYLRKCLWYIIGMIFVMHPYLLRFPVEYYNNYGSGDALHNFTFSVYFHGIESLSGLIYWLIYIYNKNLIRRFLILFCNKKEEEYINEFYEEKKIYEESIYEIINQRNTINSSLCADFSINSELKIFNIDESYPKSSYYSHDENL